MSRKEEVMLAILGKIEGIEDKLEKIDKIEANTKVIMAEVEVIKQDVGINTKAVANIGKQGTNLAIVVSEMAGQIQDLWTRMFSGFDSMGKRIRELKVVHGNGHHEGRETTPDDT